MKKNTQQVRVSATVVMEYCVSLPADIYPGSVEWIEAAQQEVRNQIAGHGQPLSFDWYEDENGVCHDRSKRP